MHVAVLAVQVLVAGFYRTRPVIQGQGARRNAKESQPGRGQLVSSTFVHVSPGP